MCSSPSSAVSGARCARFPGTGLGLTITKLLTQVMGGEITVRSTPGAGTTFTVRLLLSEAMQDASTELSRHIRGYEGARRRHPASIDDDLSHADFMRELLRPLGFEVRRVNTTAAQASQRRRSTCPISCMVDICHCRT